MLSTEQPLTFLERNCETGYFDLITYNATEQEDGTRTFTATKAPDIDQLTQMPHNGGTVLILGAGVAGLTAAYDLLKQNKDRPLDRQFQVFVLEATGRVGGRSLTLRPGDPQNPTPRDSFTEEVPVPGGGTKEVTQTLTFVESGDDPYAPYLNAGPGRIPSGHTNVLALCKELGVELEVYIMESRSNLVVTKGEKEEVYNNKANRQVVNDIRGHIAEQLHHHLRGKKYEAGSPEEKTHKNWLNLLINFGPLQPLVDQEDGDVTDQYTYKGSQRAGYEKLPGLEHDGQLLEPLTVKELADAQLWLRSIYQAEDFLWQTTSFQPVGGMDKIEQALKENIQELGQNSQWQYNPILLDCPVTGIKKEGTDRWQVTYIDKREENQPSQQISGDYCVVNIPLPLLDGLVQETDFSPNYWSKLNAVITAKNFLQPTCKVGWQAERDLWQKPATKNQVPIFGGISRIDHPMTQMWYPSDNFHGKLGALTGAYNYSAEATRWGRMLPQDRINEAREGAKLLHGEKFSEGLTHGISIAWQNIPTQKGGWCDWKKVETNKCTWLSEENGQDQHAAIMNTIRQGENNFHVIGDQVSFLPGWKEGAVMSASEVFGKTTKFLEYQLPKVTSVPNTKALVEGYQYGL